VHSPAGANNNSKHVRATNDVNNDKKKRETNNDFEFKFKNERKHQRSVLL
jgi:hypothetical protein